MHTKILFVISFLFVSCSHQVKTINYSDQYFELISKSYADHNLNFVDELKLRDENIYQQIKLDSADELLPTFWGQSFNFDSGAKKTILDEKIIEDLQSSFKIKNDNKIVHAGIMHTYGYLFSVLETPYGFKRKRWIDPTISYGFNLNDLSISPIPREGTLLSNITFFAGKMAFSEKNNLANLNNLKNVSNEIKNFDYKNLPKTTLEERVTTPSSVKITLRTTLVKLQSKMPNEENDYLLVYSSLDNISKIEKLITAFPIKKDAFLKTIDSLGLGSERPILIKYNGYLGLDHDLRLSGTRQVTENH